MKIVTLGKGFVSDHLPYEKILNRLEFSEASIDAALSKTGADVVVNCIGKTGRPNVDWCEANRAETYMTNVVLPGLIAAWCEKHGAQMIQLASGCIYFGESPNMFYGQRQVPPYEMIRADLGWREEDFANPKSYYSKTKYACDLLLGQMSNVTTLRLRMPVTSKNDSRNFINKIRCYSQLIDIPNSMTMMDDLVRCVDWAAKERKTGIYHVTNPEPISAAQVMKEYQKFFPSHKFEIIDEQQLDNITIAKRSNCILSTKKLNNAGFFMTPTEEALKSCMASYVKNI